MSLIRKLLFLLSLFLLFLITAAPGGGFGGGRGGGSGGFGGGFGGGGQGGAYYGSGPGNQPPGLMIAVLGIGVGAIIAFNTIASKRETGTGINQMQFVIVGLAFPENAEISLHDMEALVKGSDFSDSAARLKTLDRLDTVLQRVKGSAGFVVATEPTSMIVRSAGLKAETLAHAQMRRTKITPSVVNLQADGRTTRRSEETQTESTSTSSLSWGLIGLVAAVRASAMSDMPAGENIITAHRAITSVMEASEPNAIEALYIYYAPAPGEMLTGDQALEMLIELRRSLYQDAWLARLINISRSPSG